MHASASQTPAVTLPANRAAGLLQLTLALPAGAGLLIIACRVLANLNFQLSLRRMFVDYSLAFVMLIAAAIGLGLCWIGVRWLAFALWPGRLGITADATGLAIHLGPFGSGHLDLDRIQALYRFERSPDDAALSTEDFIDPDEERARYLPIIEHPERTVPVNRILETYIEGDAHWQRAALSDWIEHVRERQQFKPLPSGDGD